MNNPVHMLKRPGVWLSVAIPLCAATFVFIVWQRSDVSPTPIGATQPVSPATEVFSEPMDGAASRITLKPFGIYVSPEDSPVRPERFRGYHTGVDFETTSSEQDTDVSVSAICGGTVTEKRTATGYGGIIVQSCEMDGGPITVVYGHLRLTSVGVSVGQRLDAGNRIGDLGTGYSGETGGERKHLHLGIHRGTGIDIRGYVRAPEELSSWIDIAGYLR